MADCADIVELALALGLLRSNYEKKDMVYPELIGDGKVGELKAEDRIKLYSDVVDKRYKAIISECGEPVLPDFLKGRTITEEAIVDDFSDAVRPWLNALSTQCGCGCKAGDGKPLNILEKEYGEAVETFLIIEEAKRIVKEKHG